jgi:hypothetical protein
LIRSGGWGVSGSSWTRSEEEDDSGPGWSEGEEDLARGPDTSERERGGARTDSGYNPGGLWAGFGAGLEVFPAALFMFFSSFLSFLFLFSYFFHNFFNFGPN